MRRGWTLYTKFRVAICDDYVKLMRALEEVIEEGHYRGENYIQTGNVIIEWGQFKTTKKWYIRLYETDDCHMRTGKVRFGIGEKFETLAEGALWMQDTLEAYRHTDRYDRRVDWRLEVVELKEEQVRARNKLIREYDEKIKTLDIEYAIKMEQARNKHK